MTRRPAKAVAARSTGAPGRGTASSARASSRRPLGLRRGEKDRGGGDGAGADRGSGEPRVDRPVEADVLGEDQPPVAAQAPAVAEDALGEPLAHRPAAEEHGFGEEEAGLSAHLDIQPAGEPGAVEQDRLLGKPGETARGCQPERRFNLGLRPVGAVDLLRRLGRHHGLGACGAGNLDLHPVAAGQAAAGVDQHRLATRREARHADAEGAALRDRVGISARRPGREGEPHAAPRPHEIRQPRRGRLAQGRVAERRNAAVRTGGRSGIGAKRRGKIEHRRRESDIRLKPSKRYATVDEAKDLLSPRDLFVLSPLIARSAILHAGEPDTKEGHGSEDRLQAASRSLCHLAAVAERSGARVGRGDGFISISRSDNELSIVCREKRVPSDVQTERGWRCMKVVGPFGLDETGIIYAIVKPLAEEKIGIFLVSTYDGDHLLVKADDLDRTHEALRKAGYSFA